MGPIAGSPRGIGAPFALPFVPLHVKATMSNPPPRRRVPTFLGLLLVLMGLGVAAAGAWLIALGGSWYYLPAGLALLASGVLLWRRAVAAYWLYALLVLATLAWALWETGLDWWPLAARGAPVMV